MTLLDYTTAREVQTLNRLLNRCQNQYLAPNRCQNPCQDQSPGPLGTCSPAHPQALVLEWVQGLVQVLPLAPEYQYPGRMDTLGACSLAHPPVQVQDPELAQVQVQERVPAPALAPDQAEVLALVPAQVQVPEWAQAPALVPVQARVEAQDQE